MGRASWIGLAVGICIAWGTPQGASGEDRGEVLKAPRLFVTLPDTCPTPDSLVLDRDGNLLLSCPNFADPTQPGVLMKIDPQNRPQLWYQMPVHPKTGRACPMGLAFGPEGDLYVADNQGWAKPNNLGRLLRLKIKDQKVQGVTVVADAMSHPNGVRVHGDYVYVSQSLLVQKEGESLVSGVYRFRLDDENVQLSNTLADKNLFATFTTRNPKCQYGVDGIVFDRQGNLFVANFGDATIHKVVLDAQGNVVSNTLFAQDPRMKSVDGICMDGQDNIYAIDFSNNAVFVVSPTGAVRPLAKSPDGDGADGGLDEPADAIVRGKELIVVNFDTVVDPGKVNTRHDKPYTLSVIDLEK